jgi:DNA-binding MarR family transcriptional regulator
MGNSKHQAQEPLAILVDRVRRSLLLRLQNNFSKAGHDITGEQWMLLHLLWQEEGRSQQQLANKLGKNKASIVPMLDRLEKKNIIVRIQDKTDGRQKLIYLTSQGKSLEVELEALNDENLERSQTKISRDDLQKTRAVMQQMIDNLE